VNSPFDNHRTRRLGLAASLALVLALAAAPAATAGWVTAGNSTLAAHEESTFACTDGVQTAYATNGDTSAGSGVPGPFFATHPWVWAAVKVAQSPTLPVPTVVDAFDEVVVLPRMSVDTGQGGVKLYSGLIQVHSSAPLTRGWFVRLLNRAPLEPIVGSEPNPVLPNGFPVQVPEAGCTLPPPPPIGGRGCLGGDGNVIVGTRGNDVLVGTNRDDVIVGGAGNDVINGLGGDDLLCGEDGDDVIAGGSGHDGLDGGAGDDILGAGFGNDLLLGGDGADTMSGSFGDDILKGEAGDDLLIGGAALDVGTFDPADGGPGTDACFQADLAVSCP